MALRSGAKEAQSRVQDIENHIAVEAGSTTPLYRQLDKARKEAEKQASALQEAESAPSPQEVSAAEARADKQGQAA